LSITPIENLAESTRLAAFGRLHCVALFCSAVSPIPNVTEGPLTRIENEAQQRTEAQPGSVTKWAQLLVATQFASYH
jgi:hypothetical protein